jgi:site-specific recombinase XerD
MLDHGADIRVIWATRAILPTQIYTHVSQAKAAETYRKTHPRDQL